MNPITTIIVAKDYPPHILETIKSVENLSNEIIIVDIGLAEQAKDKILTFSHLKIIPITEPVPYVELIREQTKQYATNEYVLFLDPDEIIQPELAKILIQEYTKYDYFLIPRKNIIFSSWIQNSRWWPDYQVRLFKKNSVIWPKQLHAQPEKVGKLFSLEPKEELALLHYNYESIDEFIQKMTRYAKSEAQEKIDKNENLNMQITIKNALSEFISRYFANDGYKDGMHGFVLALFQMFYCFLVYFYYWEKKKYQSEDTDQLPGYSRSFFKQGLYEVNHWLVEKQLTTKKYSDYVINNVLKMFD